MVLQDEAGNRYRVEKDEKTGETKVTKVEGGGLNPGNNTLQDVVTTDKNNPAYYITVPNDTTKYRHSDELVFIKQKSKIKLSLNGHADSLLSKLVWKIDKREICKGAASCEVDLSNIGNLKVEVLAGSLALMEVKVDVYKKPVLVFERGSGYKGEYGFDNAAFTQLQTTDGNSYGKENFNGTDYYIPWFSVRPGVDITLGIDFKGGIASKAAKDKDFKITLRSTSPDLNLNHEGQETVYKYHDLKGKTFLIVSGSTNRPADITKPYYIEAFDHKGDLVGKMAVVCGTPAMTKKVVFVFVNHGSGYPSRSVDDILNFLNQKSHNQFFSKWSLEKVDSIDISRSYKKFSSTITKSSSHAIDTVLTEYGKQTGINLKNDNPNDFYYAFISKMSIKNTEGFVSGRVRKIPSNEAIFFNEADLSTFSHELGHNIGLFHPEDDRSIPKYSTQNYMDYGSIRNMYFLYQWLKVK